MRQQHLDDLCDLCVSEIVRVRKNPSCLGKHDMRHPYTLCDELFRGFDLSGFVTRDETYENIRVNRAHALPGGDDRQLPLAR